MTLKEVLLIGAEPERMTRLQRSFHSLKELGVNVRVFNPYRVPSGRPRVLKGIIRYIVVTLQIALSKAQIYHFYNIPDVTGFPLLLKRGTFIYDVRSPWFSSVLETIGNRLLSKIAGFMEWLLTRHADIILTANTPLAERAARWGGKRVIVVPNYPPDDFGPSDNFMELKATLRLDGHPIVLYLGKISVLEGSELLKDIISKTCSEIPSVRFLIVGDGPQVNSLTKFIELEGLSESVLMVGWVPHDLVPDYISIADLCLFPRAHTSFSPYTSPENILKAGEYLALGKPVVAPKMGGFTDAEFPVIPAEPENMAQAVINYLRNPRPVDMSTRPTWTISQKKLERLYKSIQAIS